MRRAAVAASCIAVAAVAFAAVTLVALEGRAVAVLHTTSASGDERRTRVWFVENDGALLVESATPDRPFYLDLQRNPDLVVELHAGMFDRQPRILHARAELVPDPQGHEEIRRLLAQRYGWADKWIAVLADTSMSREVRVVPDHFESGAGRR
ncbi:MAG TPA: nitroreductase/quinone reductase family protein [Candidatus Limnocylindrales bacterium]|nr:nitroreductase/quinone reductase family protein [Candidatus Limnocylindrales bacterium]